MSYRLIGRQSSPIRRLAAKSGAIFAAGTLAVTVAGCSSSSSSDDSKISIGIVTKTNTNPYFVKLRETAKAEAKKQGAEISAFAGKYDGDNAGQVQAIENLISQGVKGILITPNSSKGILSAIKKARDAGIIVVALDTATEPASAVNATYATDNKKAGVLQGTWVRKTLGSTTPKTILLDGTYGSTVDTFRHDGFLKGMKLDDKSKAIVGKAESHGDRSKAQTQMENLLQREPEVNSVYTVNEPAASGAYQAIKDAGKAKDIIIGSIDGSCTGVKNVKKGIIGATVMQFPSKMAKMGVDAVVKYAKDGTKPKGFHDTGEKVITDEPVAGLASEKSSWGLKHCWG